MDNNYLITGYWGEPHVTSENDRGINAGTLGTGRFVLPIGNMFKATYIGNNTIRMQDGKLIDNGAAAGIPVGEYIDIRISNAGQGKKRNDLIVFQYEKDLNTLVERGTFVVVSGEETTGTPSDPKLYQQDLLINTATKDQMALWRVQVTGTTIAAPVQMYSYYQPAAWHHQNSNNPHGVTIAQIGAAPAGFGLGGLCKTVSSWDLATESGWYFSTGNSPQPGGGEWHGIVIACENSGEHKSITQIAFKSNVANSARYCIRNYDTTNGWSEWEWVNPPMVLGQEYRTTERWNGKPVYVMAVDVGEITDQKTVAVIDPKETRPFDRVISCVGHLVDGNYTVAGTIDYTDESFGFYCYADTFSGSEIAVTANKKGSNDVWHAYAIIKYTCNETG